MFSIALSKFFENFYTKISNLILKSKRNVLHFPFVEKLSKHFVTNYYVFIVSYTNPLLLDHKNISKKFYQLIKVLPRLPVNMTSSEPIIP